MYKQDWECMKIKDFKNEFRLICTDTWGNAMDAWFECAGQLNKRHLYIPSNWEYRPGITNDGTDSDCYWYEIFKNCTNTELYNIGNYLFRYCQFLRFKGIDY